MKFLICVLLLVITMSDVYAIKQEIVIGVLAIRGAEKALDKWQSTADYLSSEIKDVEFRIETLTLDNIQQTVALDEVDFVLTNPASYASLARTNGISRILTLKNIRLGKELTQFGAVIFTKSDRNDINQISDIKDKHFIAVHHNAFGGWRMAEKILENAHIHVHSELKKLEFIGFPQDNIVNAIIKGEADVGTVRTDILERMSDEGLINIADIKIIGEKKVDNFPFKLSTDLYPEWPFSTTPHTDDGITQKVAIALLKLSPSHIASTSANIGGWTTPLDYQIVHSLLTELKVGVHGETNPPKLVEVFFHYKYTTLLLIIIFILLTGFLLSSYRLNRQLAFSNKELDRTKLGLENEIQARQLAQETSLNHASILRKLYELLSIPGQTLDQKISKILLYGCQILNVEIAKVCKINKEDKTNEFIYIHAPELLNIHAGMQVNLEDTICAVVYDNNRPIVINDMNENEYLNYHCIQESQLATYIATPIRVNGEQYGTVNFCSFHQRSHMYNDVEVDLVNLIGQWISVSFEVEAIQEAKSARKLAEESNIAKSHYLAHMSHEIRTPLTTIIGLCDASNDCEMTESEQRESMITISRNSNHLLQIISDILDISKIEANQMILNDDHFSPCDLLSETLSLIKIQASEKGVELKLEFNFPLPAVIFNDALRLKQVLLNLCSNAIKFTSEGEITIAVENDYDNEMLFVTVRDSGIGLTEAQMSEIFKPFVQADAKTTQLFGGTGIGLTLSKQLIEQMGGTISVQSEYGRGSEFKICLPTGSITKSNLIFDYVESEISLKNPSQYQYTSLVGNVLLVEDTLDNQRLISRMLEDFGLKVIVADNGEDAVKKALSTNIELIFMDMRMPILNGVDAIKILRHENFKFPIIMLTANTAESDKEDCKKAGCNDFISKPVKKFELYQKTKMYLKGGNGMQAENFPLKSELLKEEPEYIDLIEDFIASLPLVSQRVNTYAEDENWVQFIEEIHKLKGLGGGYGYPLLTEVSIRMMNETKLEQYDAVKRSVTELDSLLHRMIRGFAA